MAMEIQIPKDIQLHEEHPKKTLETLSYKPSLTEESGKKVDESENSESLSTESHLDFSASDAIPVTDMQKRIQRAERFGMVVQLSEEEKRNTRAQRFGTGPTSHGSDGLKKLEEQKRKARAERFGFPAQSVADEEAKKKARLARFAPVSKTCTVEEDKKKARAIGFSQTPSGDPSQGNDNANSKKETATVGRASGGV